MKYIVGVLVLSLMGPLSGCGSLELIGKPDYSSKTAQTVSSSSSTRSDDLSAVIESQGNGQHSQKYGIGVNGFLWRSCLDVLSFMPLQSADPFGGVIITDWYSPPDAPYDRFKITAYILSSSLQSDALRVSVFRQVRIDNGEWLDMEVHETVSSDLENTVLARARELKVRTNPG